jgi:hypothetical protein
LNPEPLTSRPLGRSGLAVLLTTLLCLLPGCSDTREEEPCTWQWCTCSLFTCGPVEFGVIPLEVPTQPRTGQLRPSSNLFLEPDAPPAARFTFRGRAGRKYVFSCSPQDFERCDVRVGPTFEVPWFTWRDGTTEHVVLHSSSDGDVMEVLVASQPEVATGTFTYALAEYTDDHGDDEAGTSPVVPGPGSFSGQLDVGVDTDIFRFEALAGHVYAVRCEGAFGEGLLATLRGPDGQEHPPAASSSSSEVHWRLWAPVAGGAVLRLRKETTGAPIPYACSIEDQGTDEHANQPSGATPLSETASAPVQGVLQYRGDVDCFAFQARAGHAYVVDCGTATGDLCASSRGLLDAGRSVLPTPTALWSDGTLYVCVTAPALEFASYDMRLLDLGADQGSGASDAVPLTLDVPVSGYFVPQGDVDVFRFEARAGRVYRVSTDLSTSVQAVRLNAPDEDLFALLQSTFGRLFKTPMDEPVLLSVSGHLTYTLRVEEVGADDHADALGAATPVGANLAAAGRLDTSTDVDWFALELEARPYGVTTAARRTSLLLVESDGRTLVPWDATTGTYVPRAAGRHYLRAAAFGGFTAQEDYSLALSAR